MGRPDGAHTHGNGGGGWVALAVVALVLIAVVGKAAGKAVAEAGHVLAIALEVVLITAASLVGLAVAAALGWIGLRIYRWHVRKQEQESRSAAVSTAPVVRAEVIAPEVPAIEAPKPRLDPYTAAGIREEVTDDAR